MNRSVLLLLTSLVAVTGCQKSKPAATAAPESQTKIDACSLITKDELQKVQESPVTDVKPNETSDTSFRFSQCFYTTETFNKSVSLAVTQRNFDSPTARDPKEFWKGTFGRYAEQMKEKKGKEKEGDEEKKKSLREQDEEGGTPPKRIEGVGEDAWWTVNRVGGALYALKKNVFIRISVGGPEPEEAKLAKTKALAIKALSRL